MPGDQDLSSEPPVGAGAAAPPNPAPKSSVAVTVFIWLVIVGFIAAGIGGIKAYVDRRAQTNDLVEDGLEAEATVIHVLEITRPRQAPQLTITVSFSPEGSTGTVVTDVFECSEDRLDDAETVRIVYLPDDPEMARLAGCVESVDSWLHLVIGPIFLSLGLLMLWGSIKRRKPKPSVGE